MKKRSLLALVLAFTLIMSVCTCAFGGLVASAATAVPTYDPWSSEKIATYGTQVITETKTVLDIPEFENTGAVYTKTTVTRNDANILNTTPVILLAETDSDIVHDTRGNFKNSHLVMWMAAGGGYSIGLLGSDVTGKASFPESFIKFTDQNTVTGFHGYSGLYPGGGASILNYQEVITKIENGKISVWMKDSSGNVKEILREYSNADYNITGPAAGYLSSAINSNRYNYKCDVWTDVNFENRTQVGNFETQVITESKTVLDITEYESDAAVYTKTTVTRNDANTLNTTPVILLAETDSDIVHDTRGNFKNSHLVMWMAAGGGYAIGLLGSDVTSTASFPQSFNKFADQNTVTGFYGYSGLYPGGGASILNYQEVITKIENGKISVWMKDSAGNVKEVLREYTNAAYNITGPAAGYLSSAIISNHYNYACEVWVDGIVELPEEKDESVFDEETQKSIIDEISSGIKANTTMELYDIDKYIADGAAVYTKTVVKPTWAYNDYSGPFVALAATNYKADENDTNAYYLGVYCLGGHGWGIAVANNRNQVGGTYVKYDMLYSNGTMQFPADGLEIISKVADGKISVWIDGALVLENYSSTKYDITAPVLGACAANGNGYSLNGTKVWVNNEDYAYLGDLNGDMQINLLDFIGMHKVIAQDADYQAFNENVVAFNDEGTLGNDELIMMKKYLLGVIDKLEAASAFGEDTVPADGLL